jgi:hypothetical protein
VVQAINRKTEQYYVAQEYEFRIDRERKESERKAIEAAGVSEFQRIVSQGISDSYLRWRGVEATLQLAQSNNSKVVIIGGGKDGLPIILGNVDSPAPTRAPAERGAKAEERLTAEKIPAADTAKQAAAPATPSAAPAGEPGASLPLGLSDLKALVSKALRAAEAVTEPPAKAPSERPAAEQTQ